jgi:uncharacterized protein (TIGR02646 family)
MYKLKTQPLGNTEQTKLDALQAQIDSKATFAEKTKRAKSLWNNKNSAVFEPIIQTLITMCLSVKTCNYCEQNEANDIEHIFPKSFFPEKTFRWENYLLACKQCNSGYKLDKCFVIDSNDNILSVERGTKPSHTTMAFVDPRTENPNDFFILNTRTWTFEIKDKLTKKNQHKAERTLEILQLNNRDYLIEGRKSTANRLYNLLDRLARINHAQSVEEIEEILSPDEDMIDTSLSIEVIKQKHLKQTRKVITEQMPHPSVWYAIKMISSKVHPKWKVIFDAIPELSYW